MIRKEIGSRLIFCSQFNFGNDIFSFNKTNNNGVKPESLPSLESILDYWHPPEERSIDNLLEDFEYLLERARLLNLTSRPFLEFVNSVLIYLYSVIERTSKGKECFEQLVRDAHLDCIKLLHEEGLESKILTNLHQFVTPKLKIPGDVIADCKEASELADDYFKFRGISKPNMQAKIDQIEMLEGKILVSDMQSLEHIPLISNKYIDQATTDIDYKVKSSGSTCIKSKKKCLETKDSVSWIEKNNFIRYIKSTNANVIKIMRYAIMPVPIHSILIITTGELDFEVIEPQKSGFQPLIDMLSVDISKNNFSWSQFALVKDKVELLYSLERLPSFVNDNYVDSYFKVLPQVSNRDFTNYSSLKIKIAGQDTFNFDAKQLKISSSTDNNMINYVSLEDPKYELSKLCAIVTLKVGIVDSNGPEIQIHKNCYPSIKPRFRINLTISDTSNTIQMTELLEKCATMGIKHLVFILESCNLAYIVCKSLCCDLERRSQFTAAPWYNKYFGISIHVNELSSNSTFLGDLFEFLDQRALIY